MFVRTDVEIRRLVEASHALVQPNLRFFGDGNSEIETHTERHRETQRHTELHADRIDSVDSRERR